MPLGSRGRERGEGGRLAGWVKPGLDGDPAAAGGISSSRSSVRSRNSSAASGALPVAVVVDDQHAAGRQPRVEVLELVPRRLVPVGVEPQQRDLARAPAPGTSPRPGPDEVHALAAGSPPSAMPACTSSRAAIAQIRASRGACSSSAAAAAPSCGGTSARSARSSPRRCRRGRGRGRVAGRERASATACMLPPRQTPHSTMSPGMSCGRRIVPRDQRVELLAAGHRARTDPAMIASASSS